MFRPERMASTSIICVRKDVELILEALNSHGEFHIEHAAEKESVAEYNQSIQKVEEDISNLKYLIDRLTPDKPGLFDIFRATQPAQTRVTAENWQSLSDATSQEILTLKNEVEEITVSLNSINEKTARLDHIKDMLTTMEKMGADLAATEELKLIQILIACVPHKNLVFLKAALAGFPIILHRCYLTKGFDFVCLAMPSKVREDVERILKIHHGEIFQIPKELPHDVADALKEINSQLSENVKGEATLRSSLKKLGEENRKNLAEWKENAENIRALLQAKLKILQSGRLATIKGFVSKKEFQTLKRKIQTELKGRVLVIENETTAVEDPPTKFHHSRFVKPFEEITKLYGLPHYEEFDPTPLIAITFPLIFGLMFADIGQGLTLLVGGLAVGTLIKKNHSIKNMCWILASCGGGAILGGLLFGEFFGTPLFAPLWFDPFNNVLSFLIFSLVIGVIQITSGIVIEMINFAFKRDAINIVFTSIPKIAFYLGSVYLIAVYQLNFGAWLSGPILLALVPFFVLVFGEPIFSAVASFGHSVELPRERKALGERLFEGGDLVTRLLSNTMSYTRILALLMAHWALMLTTFVVAGLIGSSSTVGLILSGVVIVGGNLFVIALEGLIVFIHALRLHFYEWFSKFYQGNGTEFTPFKQNFIYTKVVLKENQQTAASR